ncbi:MAG: fructose-like system component [Thermoanaerobacteraceae bacterium]|jgi:fructose-specific PTS system IIB-like component|nr:fructose-like system component [Thermoanaerobacteraceae bacterium]MDN5303002.1 fructose-like system component [Thermoanaerobacteraceae bacterium]MDN5312960.1 fructose-like system component [Thermoanaerobacteraceae bacterium]
MKIVAVTACPSGVAHTYMAAEALEKAAKKKGITIKVETQGSIGIENEITQQEADEADVVILTKDMGIKNTQRFSKKPIIQVGVGDAIKKADAIMDKLLEKFQNK